VSSGRDPGPPAAGRSWATVAMASTASGGFLMLSIAWLATRCLTGAEQGYFFSFLSFGALVQLADFGLSYAALQTAGRLAGTNRLDELPAVSRTVGRWNLGASSFGVVVVAAIGGATLSTGSAAARAVPVDWIGPWLAYLLAVFVNQLTAPRISLREGSGKVLEMWRLRFAQEWAAGAMCIGVLAAGGALWSLAAFAAARAVLAVGWLGLGDPLRSDAGLPGFSLRQWMTDVWPFQWKIGLSGLSGFLIFRAFSPIVFLEKGPDAAGQFGLAISLMNLLISISSAWPMSQAARYSTWIAAGRYRDLRREFPRLLVSSTAVAAGAATTLAASLWLAREIGLNFALRLTEPKTTTIILAAAVVHHVVLCVAMFLRAEGREPLLGASVLGGLATVAVVWLVARHGTSGDIAVANLICSFGGIPVVFHLLRSRGRAWQASANAGGTGQEPATHDPGDMPVTRDGGGPA